MRQLLLLLPTLLLLISCKNEPKEPNADLSEESITATTSNPASDLLSQIESAHHKTAYLEKEVIQFDIDLNFNGNDKLDATLFLSTDSKYVRIERKDGSVLLFDGEKVWLTPESSSKDGARFDVFTWSYFFNLPYKLSDTGTNVVLKDDGVLRLTFDAGTGDAPDDWYDLYKHSESDLLIYAGYIVTYGGTPAVKAATNAHAIGYEDYKSIDGIPIAHQWKFYNYSDTVDTTTTIGDAVLSNIKFIGMDKQLFQKPDNAVEITL